MTNNNADGPLTDRGAPSRLGGARRYDAGLGRTKDLHGSPAPSSAPLSDPAPNAPTATGAYLRAAYRELGRALATYGVTDDLIIRARQLGELARLRALEPLEHTETQDGPTDPRPASPSRPTLVLEDDCGRLVVDDATGLRDALLDWLRELGYVECIRCNALTNETAIGTLTECDPDGFTVTTGVVCLTCQHVVREGGES